MFDGIPFGKDRPYSYFEAKRVLRLAMDDLRKRSDLMDELGMDSKSKGRPAITGREGTRIWDFLSLAQAQDAENFTQFPHLTLSIHQEQLLAIVTVPHGIRREFRRNLLARGREGFCALFRKLLDNFNSSLRGIEGTAPWVEVLQRRYPTQRSEPIIDARLQFDLRTAFEERKGTGNSVKQQQQWLDATYEALAEKNSNLQLGVGAIFRYERCPDVQTRKILDHVANVWIGCKPLIKTLLAV